MDTDHCQLLGLFTQDDSFEFKAGFAEVKEEGDFFVGGFKVVDALGGVNFVEGGDGFEFEDDGFCNKDIGEVISDEKAVVVNGNGELGLDLQAGFAEFMSEGVFVNFFEEAAAESVGDFDCAADDFFGQLLMDH
jgi:hypothetical protein